MDLTILTIEELYSEIADLAREQNVVNQETWNALVDEVVDGHMDLGEISEDDDPEAMKEALNHRYDGFHEEIIDAADFLGENGGDGRKNDEEEEV